MRQIILVLVLLLAGQVNSLELYSGVIARGKDTIKTDEQAKASVAMTEIIKADNAYHGRSYGYTNMGSGSIWLRFYRNLSISSVDINSKTYLGNWPLTRWSGEKNHQYTQNFTLPYNDESFANDELRQETYPSKKGIGCLNDTPLRYGDINNDSSKELVLLLGELNHTLDMIVFSPEQEKTIFGVRLAVHDSQANEYGDYSDYDYISTLDLRSAYRAFRSYAKVFLVDFDSDVATPDDIFVWRKAYFANHKDNPVKGFSLDASLFSHFSFVEGEYVLQDTSEEDVKIWLAENELTWSKGYPSKSECAGEEGQLIPEMHDPLLNDPDVLK